MKPIRLSEFQTELVEDDIFNVAQLLVYRVPNRERVVAAVKFLHELVIPARTGIPTADPTARVQDATLLLIRALVASPLPPRPKFWRLLSLVRWLLLKLLRAI
jgi:hypothetical protein